MNRVEPGRAAATDAFLRLVHPSGAASQVLYLDGGPSHASSSPVADVILFAPTSLQCEDETSFNAALTQAIRAMNKRAVLYVYAPRRWRRALVRSLGRRGLSAGTPIAHLRSGDARYYVPLSARCVEFAIRTWPLSPRWRKVQRLLKAFPRSSGLLGWTLPSVGFAIHLPGDAPFDWLLNALDTALNREAIVATSWRGAGAALAFAFSEQKIEPDLIVKSASNAFRGSIHREAKMLEEVAPTTQAAAIAVPRIFDYWEGTKDARLTQTAVLGQPVSMLLRSEPQQLESIIERLSISLAAWHRATITQRELTAEHCETLLHEPVRKLLARLERGTEYLAWLSLRISAVIGRTVPFVCAHNDLTMSNVLQDYDGRMGLVDWEVASACGLPLGDFWYGACDAAIFSRGQDRPSAFDDCFSADGELRPLIAAHEQRLRSAVGGPREWIDLCFHACWLQHAANEQSRGDGHGEQPFLAIAQRLVGHSMRPA